MINKLKVILFLFSIFCITLLQAQEKPTVLQGRVTDAQTGEALPFVQIGFVNAGKGTTSDMDGRFSIDNNNGLTKVRFQMMGYNTMEMEVEAGTTRKNVKIALEPRSKVMREVVVTAKKKDQKRYRRRNNPAIELVQKAIEHKEQNRVQSIPRYNRYVYEKTNLALDNFQPDFEGKRLWQKLNFLEKYIDVTPFDATPILTVSMREIMMQQSWRRRPRQNRTLITAKRMEGVDQVLGQEGIDESISAMFVPIDIYDNDVEIMLNHFVSPLHTTLATTFYKYYITDTTDIDGVNCVELSFVPANQQSYGFTGRMYIALDSSYAVVRYNFSVSPHVNLNFVRDLTIIQSYLPTPDSIANDNKAVPRYLPYRSDTYGRMYLHKKLQNVYAQQTRINYNYNISDTASLLPDSLFTPLTNTASLPKTHIRRRVWNEIRPITLTYKETVIDSLRYELARLPEFQTLKKVAEISFTGYIPTSYNRDSSLFDIGPVFNFLSFNHEEGWRVRIGGMTTAKLNPRNFLEGFAAYGFGDRRPKFDVTFVHTFEEKNHHSHESPQNYWSFKSGYELESPGQSFDNFDRDNFIMSNNVPHKLQYVAQCVLRLRKQWPSNLRLDTWIAARHYEPTSLLKYEQYQEDGTLKDVGHFRQGEWMGKLTFSPNRSEDSQRPGSSKMMNLRKDTPTIDLSHRIGIMDGGIRYQRTDFSASKRFWLGAFGNIDTKLISGIVWNRVPYPLLYFPNGNDNIFLSSSAFNSMKPMEFVADQYVALFATYHLKGWILNNIPIIKRLRFREVVGFNMVYGGLSAKNNPSIVGDGVTGTVPEYNYAGLYKLPTGTLPLGELPYMEYSIGIENILKFIRIDYIRRLTYDEGMTAKEKGFFRIELKFTL